MDLNSAPVPFRPFRLSGDQGKKVRSKSLLVSRHTSIEEMHWAALRGPGAGRHAAGPD